MPIVRNGPKSCVNTSRKPPSLAPEAPGMGKKLAPTCSSTCVSMTGKYAAPERPKLR